MSKFKVGDRVIVDGITCSREFNKAIGTIVVIEHGLLGVNFDNNVDGHALSGYCKVGYGWWIAPSSKCIRRYNDRIIIYRDGDKVVAKDYLTNEIGVSRCHPDDEFDFKVGAKIAFDRLIGNVEPKPKYYNGKVVCIKSFSGLTTKGKIYEFVDGHLTYDNGDKSCDAVHSFEDIGKSFVSEFIEVVE